MTAALFVVNLTVLRDRIRIRTALLLVALSQVALHPLLAAAAPAGPGGHGAHGAASAGAGWSMLGAHALAVVAMAVLLVLQDRMLSLARDWLDRRMCGIAPGPPRWAKTWPSRLRTHVLTRLERLLCSPRRGPPRRALTAS